MLSSEEAAALEARNYRAIKEMIIASYTVGVNLMKPSRLGNALKLWNIMLMLSSLATFYGHWQLFVRYIDDIPRIVETTCTVFQTLMSIVKMLYYLLAQHKFYVLLKRACSHELLLECEIFYADFPIGNQLKLELDRIMSRYWLSTRRQLLFYLFCCILICGNYYVNSFGVNLYHYYTRPDGDFEIILPFPSLYPEWHDKGMAFPYYHIQMYIEACAVYISGICAVSFDSFFIVLCLHGVGLMKALNHMVECSTSSLVPPERRVEYLRYCIYQYQRVTCFVVEVNNCFRSMILIQFLLSLLAWGLVLFQLSIGLSSSKWTLVRMLMYLAAGGYQIVIYCYNGQQFTTASEDIPMAFYSCDWYEESREFRQLIKMMLRRTNRVFHLDISWFTKMSLPTLMWMIKTSGQYFLLLRNVSEK